MTQSTRATAQDGSTPPADRRKVVKVTIADVEAAKSRVALDRRLKNPTPEWIVRLAKVGSR